MNSLFGLLLSTLAVGVLPLVNIQDPPGDLNCIGSVVVSPLDTWLVCSPENCAQDCDKKARAISGGGYSIFCKCPDAWSPTPCCTIVLVILPGEEPFPVAVGNCDPVGGECDPGDDCTLVDVYEDGSLWEGWCF
ncbi:MAG: hypothetical protein U1F29_04700 [Planctomycetota bacterium]